jgi:hypothetical protein
LIEGELKMDFVKQKMCVAAKTGDRENEAWRC